MNWPLISRRRHVACMTRMAENVQALTTENDELRKRVEQLLWLEREELKKRLWLEREVRFRYARMRSAMVLLGVEEAEVVAKDK